LVDCADGEIGGVVVIEVGSGQLSVVVPAQLEIGIPRPREAIIYLPNQRIREMMRLRGSLRHFFDSQKEKA